MITYLFKVYLLTPFFRSRTTSRIPFSTLRLFLSTSSDVPNWGSLESRGTFPNHPHGETTRGVGTPLDDWRLWHPFGETGVLGSVTIDIAKPLNGLYVLAHRSSTSVRCEEGPDLGLPSAVWPPRKCHPVTRRVPRRRQLSGVVV